MPGNREGPDVHSPSRRRLLAAVGTAALGGVASGRPARQPPRLAVSVHPDARFGWNGTTRAARDAVRVGVEQVATRAEHSLDLRVETSVTAGEPVPPDAVSTTDQQALFDSVERWLRDRDAYDDGACHLYLPRLPFDQVLGYGAANRDVASGGAVAFANLGATELWDDRAVSKNMAVHEWLHTVLRPDIAAAVNGSRCEHDLGAVARRDVATVVVTPLATSYADTTLVGGETRWHGSGCYDHESFSVHDGRELRPRYWTHTWQLSDATLRATTRYVDEHLR
ncbi:hypothetical protein SAMN05192554_109137 [Haloarchaeobius iranensis]|uniref:Uncharacterized protein n=1 Tax=Haloarchaeobius iranensis TaxID=996166 RepID=A0A1G9X3Q1_9EURY|nr:hypothetical protein SAMN05192554_109137 [Haloarchaeobius iranensis]